MKNMNAEQESVRELLERLHDRYNREDFIADDPISIPHMFSMREDREISGFLAATIAWGNRKAIVKSARRMVEYLDGAPYDFVRNAEESDYRGLESFVHRTFNGRDFASFVRALGRFYNEFGGLGEFFEQRYLETGDMRVVLSQFRQEFFCIPHEQRCEKHLSSIDRKAACKRLNMYLRWMVRRDDRGVDFGMWERIPMSALYLPLDVHSANTSRSLGLLMRRQNDWKAVEEVTETLRRLDAEDPVRFDFALFGAGINGSELL